MNNEIEKNLYFGVLGDDGSYTRIEKIADDVKIIYSFKIPNKKNANKKYKKFYALLKQKEMHIRNMFIADAIIEMTTRITKALENAILNGSEQL